MIAYRIRFCNDQLAARIGQEGNAVFFVWLPIKKECYCLIMNTVIGGIFIDVCEPLDSVIIPKKASIQSSKGDIKMWNEISDCWRIAFEEAWTAFCKGCVPIGAALFDSAGILLLRDHNRGAEKETMNRKISHAEANILHRLDTDRSPNSKTLVLYTTMEPCPMCMGTCVMSNIRHVRYAARDPWCGFVYLAKQEPYLIAKQLDYTLEGGQAEFVQITLQSLYELIRINLGLSSDVVLTQFRSMLPEAVTVAESILSDRLHLRWLEEKRSFSRIFDEILTM